MLFRFATGSLSIRNWSGRVADARLVLERLQNTSPMSNPRAWVSVVEGVQRY